MTQEVKWANASFRFATRTLAPKDITERLGVVPTYVHEKGTPVSSRLPKGPKRQEAMWCLESGLDESCSVEATTLD
jgi:Domain of unknown function (DUF4279)